MVIAWNHSLQESHQVDVRWLQGNRSSTLKNAQDHLLKCFRASDVHMVEAAIS